jgi:hypothetical protein
MVKKKKVNLFLDYPYYGASCLYVTMLLDESPLGGYAELYNDYGEKMFTGNVPHAISFMNDLMNKKYI